MTTSPPVPRSPRRGVRSALAALTAGALALGGLVAAPGAAFAAAPEGAITDAVFEWGLSNEAGGGAFFGGCNFLSAGAAGDAGSARVWTEADGFYKSSEGNVSILKDGPEGSQVTPTWATKCQTGAGTAVSAGSTASKTGNVVRITEGTGAVAADGSFTIEWDGDFTVVFYGGLTYWSASDPVLTVDADGNGQVTATASGYGTSMEDMTQWVPIAPEPIVLADLSDVEADATGFTVTPDYLGVTVETTATPQTTSGDNWGSFPQSFVDFNLKTGQSSYWYSSGGARDAAKPATPLTVSYTVTTPPSPIASVTVSKNTGLNAAGETVTVTGTGFVANAPGTNATRPPVGAGNFGGVYVVFAKWPSAWQPSEGVTSRPANITQRWGVHAAQFGGGVNAGNGGFILPADGSFELEFTVADSSELEGAYGIYTYAGGGATYAPFETFTPLTFAVDSAVPTISGTAKVGSTLTAAAGDWAADASLTYQWLREGAVIAGATASTYTPVAADSGKNVSVRVTGSLAGYSTVSETSAAVKVAEGSLVTAVPSISGTAKVGSKLTASVGSWTSGASLAYQWLREGAVIAGATASTYTAVAADNGKSVSVRVTGSLAGYSTVSETSVAVKVAAGSLTSATPKVSGTAKVGVKLTAKPGSWTSGTKLTYQWSVGGKAVKGATKSTYTPKAADRGKTVKVTVTGSKSGYAKVSKTSATKKVAYGTLTSAKPKVTGTAKVGKKLTAVKGTWTKGTKVTYQWVVGGKVVKGATKSTYTVKSADRGKTVVVKVKGVKAGYKTVTKTSAAKRVAR